MSSLRRIIASRANGARSTGPKTPEGRLIASRNNLKHGLAANAVVLTTESAERFDEMLARYIAAYQPQGPVETEYVEQMVAARWGQFRAWNLETAALDLEMDRQEPRIEEEFERIDEDTRVAVAFRSLADESRCLDLLNRYETRFRRAFDQALSRLLALQEARKKVVLPFEPSPKNEHPADPAAPELPSCPPPTGR